MSGVAICYHLISTNSAVLALVDSIDSIAAGDLKTKTKLPGIGIKKISRVTHNFVDNNTHRRLRTERVQVSPLVKDPLATPAGEGYLGVDNLLAAIFLALPQTRGLVNGIYCDSILPDIEGPDLYDEVEGIHSGSQDFIVKWIAD